MTAWARLPLLLILTGCAVPTISWRTAVSEHGRCSISVPSWLPRVDFVPGEFTSAIFDRKPIYNGPGGVGLVVMMSEASRSEKLVLPAAGRATAGNGRFTIVTANRFGDPTWIILVKSCGAVITTSGSSLPDNVMMQMALSLHPSP